MTTKSMAKVLAQDRRDALNVGHAGLRRVHQRPRSLQASKGRAQLVDSGQPTPSEAQKLDAHAFETQLNVVISGSSRQTEALARIHGIAWIDRATGLLHRWELRLARQRG